MKQYNKRIASDDWADMSEEIEDVTRTGCASESCYTSNETATVTNRRPITSSCWHLVQAARSKLQRQTDALLHTYN